MKFRLTHTDQRIQEMLSISDVGRLALRDYSNARNRGESHTDAFSFVEHRFARHNAELLEFMSTEEVE